MSLFEETEMLKGKRFLVVEDNSLNRKLLVEILEEVGVIAAVATNGNQAVKMVNDAAENYYDFVLMDIQMPKMNGYEAAVAIRSLENKEKAKVPIIATTVNNTQLDKQKALDSGMNGHLSKPLQIPALLQTVTDILQSYQDLEGLVRTLI